MFNAPRKPPTETAYLAALRMLGRREYSEAQVRQRLERRGHGQDEIDPAVDRLKQERAIDDQRVARAIARTETAIKHRGRHRVTRQIESAGIAPETARHAADEVFADVDEEALLQSALARGLRGDDAIDDQRVFQRLYRSLVRRGFAPDRVLRALSSLRRRR